MAEKRRTQADDLGVFPLGMDRAERREYDARREAPGAEKAAIKRFCTCTRNGDGALVCVAPFADPEGKCQIEAAAESAEAAAAENRAPGAHSSYLLSESGASTGHWVCSCGADLGDDPIDEIEGIFAEHKRKARNAENRAPEIGLADSERPLYPAADASDAETREVDPGDVFLKERKDDPLVGRWVMCSANAEPHVYDPLHCNGVIQLLPSPDQEAKRREALDDKAHWGKAPDHIARWKALGRAGVTVSIVYGPIGGVIGKLGFSVDAISSTGKTFQRPFAAETFEQAVEIAEIQARNRGWLANRGW